MPLLLLIDATSLAYRAFFAFQKNPLRNSKGENTSAVFAFTNSLLKLLSDYKPTHIALVFDAKGKTQRHLIYREYKAGRPKAPDELLQNLIWIKEVAKALNITVYEIEGYEADDVIATLARQAQEKGFRVIIQTSDKDIFQIINEQILALDTRPKEEILYTREKVKEKFGLPPEKLRDYFALVGDTIDNIPGIPGIGEKKAKEILLKHSLDEIIENPLVIGDEVVAHIIDKNKERLKLNKELVSLNFSVPVLFDEKELEIKDPDIDKLLEIFRALEFKSLMKKFARPFEDIEFLEYKEGIKPEKPFVLHLRDGEFAFLKEKKVFNTNIDLLPVFLKKIREIYVPDAKVFYKRVMKRGISLKDNIVYDPVIPYILLYPEKHSPDEESLALEYLGRKFSSVSYKREGEILFMVKEVLPRLMNEIFKEELDEVYFKVENPLTKVIAKMENRGVLIDKKVLHDLNAELRNKLQNIKEEIYGLAGERFNINSPVQLRRILFNKLKLKPKKRTKTGYSTDQSVLQELSFVHPLPGKILEYREYHKILSSYITPFENLVSFSKRIYADFSQIGSQTGRIVCSNPNLQTIPLRSDIGRKIRDAFICEEGYKIVVADYSQIELRILAHLSGDESLINDFIEGKDIHRITASKITGKPIEDVTEEDRNRAKVVNFGIIYGMSPYGLSKELSISVEEARSMIEDYFASYPGVFMWIQNTLRKAREEKEVRTIMGRRRRVYELEHFKKEIREWGERVAINTPVQGSAADIIKLAMIEIDKEIEKNYKDKVYMILQIHDELIFEVKEEFIEEFCSLLKDKMENIYSLRVPLKVKIGIGDSWLKAKD